MTPGVSVGASLGDIGISPQGRLVRAHQSVEGMRRSPVIPELVGNHPGDCQSGRPTAPVGKNVC